MLNKKLLGSVSKLPEDDNFENVTLLLNGDGTNGGQNNTFVDSSTNNFTITRNGNTTQGSFSPYGTWWSNSLFNPNYLTTPSNSVFAISGDFTLECWVLSSDSSLDGSTRRRVFHTGGGDIASSLQLLLGTSGGNSAVISVLNNGFLIDGTISVCTGQWVHIAVTRSGTSLKLFVNGVQSGSTATTSQNFNSGTSNTVYIGANSGGGGVWQGYISNMRLITGTALYTSAFTPPTTPLTAVSGTQLLTCQSNRFVDNSSNNLTITPTGSPSVQRFSPFEPSDPYDKTVLGGSIYLDGSGDYLVTTSSLSIGSNDNFTVEAWVYVTKTPDDYVCVVGNDSATGFFMEYGAARGFWLGFGADLNGNSAVVLNRWVHLAISRSSGTTRMFVNGTQTASRTSDTYSASFTVGVGSYITNTTNQFFPGYIADPRIIVGTALYTGNFTVPSSPLTAVTNTKFLVSATNASIADLAMQNNLETVGNAQVSTSVKKFGTGSLAFDGTGDYLVSNSPTTDLYAFGTGAFTIECWVYLNATTGTKYIYDGRSSATTNVAPSIYVNSSGVLIYQTAATTRITGSTLSTSTWYHIAVSRSGTSTKMFVDGTQVGSTYTDSNDYLGYANKPVIGSIYDGTSANSLNGYIDDLRITNGIARYTANFTAPTTAFPTY